MGTWGSTGFGPGLLSAVALALFTGACLSENSTDGLSGSGGSSGGPTNAAGALANPEQSSSSVACAEAVGDWCRVLVTERFSVVPQFLVGVDHAGDVVSVGQEDASDSRTSQVQVAKYTPDGALLWRREFGGRSYEVPHAFAIDANDDIFVVGVDGDRFGGNYAFVAKVSADGDALWMQLVELVGDAQEAFGVAVDASGNAVVVLETGAVVKYSARGERLWAQMAVGKTRGLDVVVDAAGDCFVLQGDEETSFLTKLSAAGELLWERNLANRWVSDVALDPSGGLWTLDTRSELGSHMSRYSAEGELLWRRDVVPEQSEINSLEFDTSGNAFIVGPAAGRYGAYLAKYDPDGNPLWGQALGLRGGGGPRDLAVAADGAVFITGDYPDAPTGAFIVRVSPPQ